LDQHYKIEPNTDHRTKFHAGRPTHLGDLAWEKIFLKTSRVKLKSFRKLSFSGGLKSKDKNNITDKNHKLEMKTQLVVHAS